MQLAPIGIAMLGDERRSVIEKLEPECLKRIKRLLK